MSIDYNTYVGPYVRCNITLVEQTTMRTACVNVDCKNHQDRFIRGAFCSLCGSAIQDIPTTVMADSVDDYTVSQLIDERLNIPGGDAYQKWAAVKLFHIWKPNVGFGGRDGHLESREDFMLIQLKPTDIPYEIERFREAFAADIKMLHQVYGDTAVTVEWGVIQDYY